MSVMFVATFAGVVVLPKYTSYPAMVLGGTILPVQVRFTLPPVAVTLCANVGAVMVAGYGGYDIVPAPEL